MPTVSCLMQIFVGSRKTLKTHMSTDVATLDNSQLVL
jgi:hypothetical protein